MTSAADINMIFQILILLFFLGGIFSIIRTSNVKKHRLIMGIVLVLNAISIFFIMGRSFLSYFGFIVEKFYELAPFSTWIHGITGGLAEVLGIAFLFKHPRKIIVWMRVTATLWLISFTLGLSFYWYYYII